MTFNSKVSAAKYCFILCFWWGTLCSFVGSFLSLSSALFPSFVFWEGEEPSCQFVSYNSHNFHTHEIIQWPPHAILMGELSSWKSPLQLDEKCFIIHCTAVTLPSPRTSEPKRCSHKSCRCSDHALICNMSVCRRMRYFPTGRDKNKAKNRVNNRIFILSVANFQLLPTRQVLIKKIYKRTTERRTIMNVSLCYIAVLRSYSLLTCSPYKDAIFWSLSLFFCGFLYWGGEKNHYCRFKINSTREANSTA